ncbi:SPW repeat domain-containing protein [Salinilacihabitans rarus]|uniref:SPW repeat domain-containing protein n=1 Tax=Salinilacihabitans rarus TaxID=2961596 RepID=UPI0020C8B308|nr:hypothetical protein [Salinilacihabitans rarus]
MSERESTTESFVVTARSAGLAAGIGAIVLASTAVFTITGGMGLHNVLVGSVIATVASVLAFRTDQGSPSIALAAVLVVVGLWTAASPFVFGITRELVLWLNGAAGGLVALLAVASIYGILRPSTETRSSGATGA